MNRIAEKIAQIMNDEELETLILSNYENDAQTLTSDTESNLLKLKQMLGSMSAEEHQRWEEICRTFSQNVKLRGVGGADDPTARVLVQLGTLGDNLHSVRKAIADGVKEMVSNAAEQSASRDLQSQDHAERLIVEVAALRDGLKEVGAAMAAAAPASAAANAAPPLPAEAFHEGGALHRVTVQHKVPRSILHVLESQFQLMQTWLQPLSQSIAAHDAQQAQVQESLSECLQRYEALIEELADAQSKQPKQQ